MTKSSAEYLIEQLEDWCIDADCGLRDTSLGCMYALLCNLKQVLNGTPLSIRLNGHAKRWARRVTDE